MAAKGGSARKPAFPFVGIRYQNRVARFALPAIAAAGAGAPPLMSSAVALNAADAASGAAAASAAAAQANASLQALVAATFGLSGVSFTLALPYDGDDVDDDDGDTKAVVDPCIHLPFDVALLEPGRTYRLDVHQQLPPPPSAASSSTGVGAAASAGNALVAAAAKRKAAPALAFAPTLEAAAAAVAAGDHKGNGKPRLPSPAEAAAQVAAEDAAAAAAEAGGDEQPLPAGTVGSDIVVASFAYAGRSATELSFKAGDKIRVLSQYDKDWWKGTVGDEIGFFPANHVMGLETIVLARDRKAAAAAAAEDDGGDGKADYQDAEYFDSYSTLLIHHQMLSDVGRTLAYQQAVAHCREQIRGKVVLDVGCGSGILSMFCALHGGAKHVYAAEASEAYYSALKVVKENGVSDRVTVLKGKIEDIKLPVAKVDVIISEWMGTFLVCESMIESVLWARAKYLQPQGLMMPSFSTLYLCPLSCDAYYNQRIPYWQNVHGVKMSSLMALAKQHFFEKPVYNRAIKPNELIAAPAVVYELDSHTGTPEANLETATARFEFVLNRTGLMHGFGSWFDVEFATSANRRADPHPVVLPTDPHHKPTHWKQVMFVFPDPLQVHAGDTLTGTMVITRNVNYRRHFHSVISFTHKLTASSPTANADATDAKHGAGAGVAAADAAADAKASPPPAPAAAAAAAPAAAVAVAAADAGRSDAKDTKVPRPPQQPQPQPQAVAPIEPAAPVTELGAEPTVEQLAAQRLSTAKEPLFRSLGQPRVAKAYEYRYDMWR